MPDPYVCRGLVLHDLVARKTGICRSFFSVLLTVTETKGRSKNEENQTFSGMAADDGNAHQRFAGESVRR